MPFTNTATRYGAVTKTFHWITAFLILMLIPSGIIANGLPYDTATELAAKARLFSIHKTLGVALFTVALLRILWALTQTKPAPLHPDRKAETLLAEIVHWLLYGSLVVVPLSGWIHHAATAGFAPILWPFGQDLPFVPKSERLAEVSASLHIIFERVLVISLALHIAGALKHQFIDRDMTLPRMWFGQTEGGVPAHRTGKTASLLGAVLAWLAAIGVGAWLGLFAPHERAVSPALTQVQSDWTVETGSLGITITQFGAEVAGQFTDWTAAITFDETATGTLGTVDVVISIPSLTLGSVTDQALGPDFFAAETFPTARFAADLARAETGYLATGTLTIRDQTVPVEMPFDLAITGNTAEMNGAVALDRRDFGVGMSMLDEGSLNFAVGVVVSLTANRD